DRPGRQDCPVCGKPLVVPDTRPGGPSVPQQGPGPEVGGPAVPPGTPWERRSELGIVKAWGSTVAQCLFEPSRLFGATRIERSGAQVGFAILTGSVFALTGQLLEHFLLSPQRDQIRSMLASAGGLPPAVE